MNFPFAREQAVSDEILRSLKALPLDEMSMMSDERALYVIGVRKKVDRRCSQAKEDNIAMSAGQLEKKRERIAPKLKKGQQGKPESRMRRKASKHFPLHYLKRNRTGPTTPFLVSGTVYISSSNQMSRDRPYSNNRADLDELSLRILVRPPDPSLSAPGRRGSRSPGAVQGRLQFFALLCGRCRQNNEQDHTNNCRVELDEYRHTLALLLVILVSHYTVRFRLKPPPTMLNKRHQFRGKRKFCQAKYYPRMTIIPVRRIAQNGMNNKSRLFFGNHTD